MHIIEKFLAYNKRQRETMRPVDFALPRDKKYPVITKSDVMNSIRAFHNCPQEDRREVARNLLKAARKHNIKIKDSRILKYGHSLTEQENPKPQLREDTALVAKETLDVMRALEHWRTQHDYYGPSWDGLELLLLNLSTTVLSASVEAAGWYKYPSSTMRGMDGKDWRYVFDNHDGTHGIVNCHSLLHDGVWTLTTTIYSTDDINSEKLVKIADDDMWKRSILWLIATAKLLQSDGYDYSRVIEEYQNRLQQVGPINQMIANIKKLVADAAHRVTGSRNKLFKKAVDGAISTILVPPGKVGSFIDSDSYNASVLAIHPNALKDMNYVQEIITHELIHGALDQECDQETDKSKEFQSILQIVQGSNNQNV